MSTRTVLHFDTRDGKQLCGARTDCGLFLAGTALRHSAQRDTNESEHTARTLVNLRSSETL